MNNWCVMFVKTGSEENLLQKLKNYLDGSMASPFIITKEKYLRKPCGGSIGKNICFPGYIFIETCLDAERLLPLVKEVVRHTKGMYRLLSYTGANDIFIHEHELSTLKMLCNGTNCITSSIGIIVGDRIQINSGPLIGMESIIKKIDRHGRTAVIGLDIMGGMRNVTVALEILAKM